MRLGDLCVLGEACRCGRSGPAGLLNLSLGCRRSAVLVMLGVCRLSVDEVSLAGDL